MTIDAVLDRLTDDIRDEFMLASATHGKFSSAHEAYAVILEELDEFKIEVWKKRANRDLNNMRKELIQIAAMAVRSIHDLDLF